MKYLIVYIIIIKGLLSVTSIHAQDRKQDWEKTMDYVFKRFYACGYNDCAIKTIDSVIETRTLANNLIATATLYRLKGTYYLGTDTKIHKDSVIKYFEKAIKLIENYIAKNRTEASYLGAIMIDYGSIMSEYEPEKGKKWLLKAADYHDRYKFFKSRDLIYSKISSLYYNTGDLENMLAYAHKSNQDSVLELTLDKGLIIYSNLVIGYGIKGISDSCKKYYRFFKEVYDGFKKENKTTMIYPVAVYQTEAAFEYVNKSYMVCIKNCESGLKESYVVTMDSIYLLYLKGLAEKSLKCEEQAFKSFMLSYELAKKVKSPHYEELNLMEVVTFDKREKGFKEDNYLLRLLELKGKNLTSKLEEEIHQFEIDKRERAIGRLNELKKINELEAKRQILIRNVIIVIIMLLIVIIVVIMAYVSLKRRRKLEKNFTMNLIVMQEEERKRISKELHDGIGQNLLAIKALNIEGKEILDKTIEEVRTISRNMHPVQLEKLGFKKAVESVIEDARKTVGILFTYEIDDVNELLNDNQKINLYRIVQEALSNIIRHSKSTAAKIIIKKSADKIQLMIMDKGIGFSLDEAKRKRSLGISSMIERVNLIGGVIKVETGKNTGTRIEIAIKHGKN